MEVATAVEDRNASVGPAPPSLAREAIPAGRLGQALGAPERQDLLARFDRDGVALLPGVLEERAPRLRQLIDEAFSDHPEGASSNRHGAFIMVRMFELHAEFQDLITAEPFIGLAEAVLGPDCHLIAQNTVRNRPGEAIDGFHVDEEVYLPLPADIPRHDPRWRLPCFIMTIQIMLSDVPTLAHGPSQFVLGSHFAGRPPEPPLDPSWEGGGPVSVLCRAGDIYLHNGQAWHRGAPNRSTHTRYLLQLSYARRWVSQRFHPFVDYRLPDQVVARADARGLRVLGRHPHGPYG